MTWQSPGELLALAQQSHQTRSIESLQGGLIVDQLERARAAVGHVAPAALGSVEETIGADHQPVLPPSRLTRLQSSWPVKASQSRAASPKDAVQRCLPSADSAAFATDLESPRILNRCLPVSTSHRMTVPSTLPVPPAGRPRVGLWPLSSSPIRPGR
jgi:hypothetical protein